MTRGGLADRAAQLFKTSQTSLYLWRTALESHPSQQTSPDLSFRVCKIAHTIFTGSCKPCASLTICRILMPVRPFTSRKKLIYILLRLPDASQYFPLCNPQILQEGATLRIWRPWHETALTHSSLFETPNASLPLPSSNDSSSVSLDMKDIHNTVLLCSRFLILSDST